MHPAPHLGTGLQPLLHREVEAEGDGQAERGQRHELLGRWRKGDKEAVQACRRCKEQWGSGCGVAEKAKRARGVPCDQRGVPLTLGFWLLGFCKAVPLASSPS